MSKRAEEQALKAYPDFDSVTPIRRACYQEGYEQAEKDLIPLPGLDEPKGIPGKDFIPVAWVDACELYGKWKIVRAEKDLGWIPVNDRLPEKNGWYFTCVEQFKIPQCVGITYFDKKDSLWLNDIPMGKKSFMTTIEIVDYWMPIPELPKEDIGK